MQQIHQFGVRKIYEFYLGIQIISILAIIIFSRYFVVQLNSVHAILFILLYSLYVLTKTFRFIHKFYFLVSQEAFQPKLLIAFTDGIFLSFFLYITRDYFYILSHLFYIYILLLIILFYHRHTLLCSSFTAVCYTLLVILQDLKMLLSLTVITQVFLFYLLGYIMSSVMTEINKLETHMDYMYGELEHKNLLLNEMVNKDYLTSLYNHMTFYSFYRELIQHSVVSHSPFSLALLDIDNFKNINDTHGHLAGDIILKEVSALVLANIRKTDIAARYGGEEFAIIFPDTSPKDAEEVCERIREVIENYVFDADNEAIKVTISGGIAGGAFSTLYCKQNMFLEFVDQLLYKAKSEGKNQIQSSYQIIMIDS